MSERDSPINAWGSGRFVQRLPHSRCCIEGRSRQKAQPTVGQLDGGLWLSPQRLRSDKALKVKRLSPRQHVVHGAAQLMGEHRQGLGFAVFTFKFGKIRFARLALTEEEHGGFGKGPASVHVADLFAGRAQPCIVRFLGALHQATIRDEVLYTRKALNVLNFV
jgi:hypothetical protein